MPMRRAVKIVPPVIMDESVQLRPDIGPIVVMSGFLTKRTRTLNRWRQRWWQLLDNGVLLYFKNDDRIKLLGEIDIARTCYDVRLGAKKCGVSFPRVAPSCCCISFAVLKRTYYVYAPTADEANRWAESITKASRVLNRKLVAGVQHRRAPEPPGPPRPPSCPPNFRINRLHLHTQAFSISDSMEELENERLYENGAHLAHTRKMASSVPDFLDRMAYSSPVFASNGNQQSVPFQSDPRRASMRDSVPSTARSVANNSLFDARSTGMLSPQSSSYSNLSTSKLASYSHTLDSLPETSVLSVEDREGGTMPRIKKRRKRVSLPANFLRDFHMLESKEAQIRQQLQAFDLPPRPASSLGFSSYPYSYQPPCQMRPRGTSFGSERLVSPPLMSKQATKPAKVAPETKSKPVPKPRKAKGAKPLPDANKKKKKEPAFVTATRILRVYPTPTATETSTAGSDMENSVTMCTAQITVTNKSVAATNSPPPRPRKDSGPPSFVPLPPRKDSGPPNFVPTPPPVEILADSVAQPTPT